MEVILGGIFLMLVAEQLAPLYKFLGKLVNVLLNFVNPKFTAKYILQYCPPSIHMNVIPLNSCKFSLTGLADYFAGLRDNFLQINSKYLGAFWALSKDATFYLPKTALATFGKMG